MNSTQSRRQVIQRFRKWALVVAITLLCGPIPALGDDVKEIELNWTDTGVYMLERPEWLKQPGRFMFQPFPQKLDPVFPEIRSNGQILIPMPLDKDLPQSEAEWANFTIYLSNGMKERIQQALKNGMSRFEIRTVQNITIKGGYMSREQQARVVRFTQAFLEALSRAKGDLASDGYRVHVNGVVGSNGGYAAARTIPLISRNPLDRLILDDARAYVPDVIATASRLNGNVVIINTGGDAAALPDMIASLDGAKLVKQYDPRVRVIYTDPKGWNIAIFARGHLAAMHPDKEMWVKEWIGDRFASKSNVSAGRLLASLLQGAHTVPLGSKTGPGRSKIDGNAKRRREDPLPPPPGCFLRCDDYWGGGGSAGVPIPPSGGNIPGEVGAGGLARDPKGVLIDPDPRSIGSVRSPITHEILKNRPSDESAAWDVGLPFETFDER